MKARDVGLRKATPKKPRVWQKAFLAAFSRTGIVTHAAKVARVHPATVWSLRQVDLDFAAAWDQARETAADLMEKEALKRAVDGWIEPVYGSGGDGLGTVRVGEIRKKSDTLLIFLLKAARPEKFRERFEQKLTGSVEVRTYADLVRLAAEKKKQS